MAFHTARLAQEQGATVVLTGFGRLSLVRADRQAAAGAGAGRRTGRHRPGAAGLAGRPGRANTSTGIDGVLHSIGVRARPPRSAGSSWRLPWEDVATTVHTSAFSLKALAVACLPLMTQGGSIVGLDFDARQAWPAYDWMGVAKAALESDLALPGPRPRPRRHPGQSGRGRAGPDHGRQVDPRFLRAGERLDRAGRRWAGTPPTRRRSPGPAVALLSDLFPATTGSMVMVDGGFSALGFSSREIAEN